MATPRFFVLTIVLISTFAFTSVAQGQTHVRLSGVVVDPSGAAVSGVNVGVKLRCKCSDCPDPNTCECCPGQISTTTDEEGRFSVSVVPGTYTVSARNKEITVNVSPGANNSVRITVE
jgi:hypothetical protein